MAPKEAQTGLLPFLSQTSLPAWAQVVDAAPNQGALNVTAQLQAASSPVFYSMHRSAPLATQPPENCRLAPGKKQNAGTPQASRPRPPSSKGLHVNPINGGFCTVHCLEPKGSSNGNTCRGFSYGDQTWLAASLAGSCHCSG